MKGQKVLLEHRIIDREQKGLLKGVGIIILASLISLLFSTVAFARDINYQGAEVSIYVKAGEPTQITFPDDIEGGFKRENSSLSLDRQDRNLIIFPQPQLGLDGEGIIVHLRDKRTYSLRIIPSSDEHQRDSSLIIRDTRPRDYDEEDPLPTDTLKIGPKPASTVPGFMQRLTMRAEFGYRKRIPGYRASNRYSGEVVLHDGTVKAVVDEILIGSTYWGYVLTVENLLNTTQKINPASFRLDGTRAISAKSWQLAPRPLTAEQRINGSHRTKVYIITRARRRTT